MSDGTVLLLALLFVGLPALALIGLKYRRGRAKSRPQFGETVVPNGLLDPRRIYLGPRFPKSYGGNYSPGVPEHPQPHPDGVAVPIPQRSSHGASGDRLNYVGLRTGPLGGKTRLRLKGRIEMAPDVKILAHNSRDPDNPSPGAITMFFQRDGDDWSSAGKMEAYRWYSAGAVLVPLTAGDFELVAPLDDSIQWNATTVSSNVPVPGSSLVANPKAFRDAKANAANAGFVAGGGESYAHGFYATGPARLIVTSFTVE